MTESPTTTPSLPTRDRLVACLALGTAAAAYATARALHEPNWPTDFDQIWHAARALLAGEDPYAVVGPDRPFSWLWPLYYPLPAVLLAVPFAVLPVLWARVAFSTVMAALLGWALGPRLRTFWPLMLSAAFIIAVSRAQWAPALLAAAWLPALGFLLVAKPNVGVASLAAHRGPALTIAAASGAALVLLSFIVQPDWLASWRQAISSAPHIDAAVTTLPAGPLLALAALRWKRPEARLFLALAIVPHTPSLYDLLPLFFACRTRREVLALALLTQALYWGIVLFGSFDTFDAYAEGLGRAAVFVVYLPVLLAILLRPNEFPPVEPGEPAERSWLVPAHWIDAILLSVLLVAGVFLVWLPLVTYR